MKKISLFVIAAKILVISVVLIVFFSVAPGWENSKIRGLIASDINAATDLKPEEKQAQVQHYETIDFGLVCASTDAQLAVLKSSLTTNGFCRNYDWFKYCFWISLGLFIFLAGVLLESWLQAKQATKSSADLIRTFGGSWKLSTFAVFVKLFVQTPLLTFALFEFTVLLASRYYPKLLIVLIAGAGYAIYISIKTLLKKVPLEFGESMARLVRKDESTELWSSVETAAKNLKTSPPDNIVVGMTENFYVTEMNVNTNSGVISGRTLYLSHPLMKNLSCQEVLGIIGHELGHFIGEDTKLTKNFYPFLYKVSHTMDALANSGWAGFSALHLLEFFNVCYYFPKQEMSRKRELLADQFGIKLTSASVMASALLKTSALSEALYIGISTGKLAGADTDLGLSDIAKSELFTNTDFWNSLAKNTIPHPLDSHPPIGMRIQAMGLDTNSQTIRQLTESPSCPTAFEIWFDKKSGLFKEIKTEMAQAIQGAQTQAKIVNADVQTQDGRLLLEQNFPREIWKMAQWKFWIFFLIVCGLTGIPIVFSLVLHNTDSIFWLLGSLPFAYFSHAYWKNHKDATITLTYEGVTHSGFKRPILFSQVKDISAINNNGSLIATFHFTEKQDPYWKTTIMRYKHKGYNLTLSNFNIDGNLILAKLIKYYLRRLE